MSNFYTCTYCGKSIEISHKDIHENYCLYVPKNEEFNDLIPCEICHNFINFSDYEEHVENCGRISDYSENIRSFMSIIENYLNQHNEQTSNTDESNENNENNENTENTEELESNTEELLQIDESVQNANNTSTSSILSDDENPNIFTTMNPVYNSPFNININIPIESFNNLEQLPLFQEIINGYQNIDSSYTDSYTDLTNLSEQLGDVEIGIDNLDEVLVDIKTEDNQKINCPICHNTHSEIKRTLCNHDFCFECISTWLSRKKTCPICLKDLTEINQNKQK